LNIQKKIHNFPEGMGTLTTM